MRFFFLKCYVTWGSCPCRITAQTFLQTSSRNPYCAHSVVTSAPDAFGIRISRAVMPGEVSGRCDVTAAVNSAWHHMLQAPSLGHLHPEAAPSLTQGLLLKPETTQSSINVDGKCAYMCLHVRWFWHSLRGVFVCAELGSYPVFSGLSPQCNCDHHLRAVKFWPL